VTAWWADWNETEVAPTPAIVDNSEHDELVTAKITCSGKPQFKVGGSSKTFTISYYDDDVIIQDHEVGTWSFSIDGENVNDELLSIISTDDANKIKVKFLGDDMYVGKILTVTNTFEDVTASMQIEIIAL